jgi:hypothetical protein
MFTKYDAMMWTEIGRFKGKLSPFRGFELTGSKTHIGEMSL